MAEKGAQEDKSGRSAEGEEMVRAAPRDSELEEEKTRGAEARRGGKSLKGRQKREGGK